MPIWIIAVSILFAVWVVYEICQLKIDADYTVITCDRVNNYKIVEKQKEIVDGFNMLDDDVDELLSRVDKLEKSSAEYTGLKQIRSDIGKLQKQCSNLQMLLDAMPEPLQVIVEGIQPDNPNQFTLWHSCKNKTPFNSELEAQNGADYFGKMYGKEFKIYQCKYCSKWHMATKE